MNNNVQCREDIYPGCKEKHFYSLPFGQAEASIYQPRRHFNQPQKRFVLLLFKLLIKHHLPVGQVKNRIHQPDSKIHQPRAIGHYFLCTLHIPPTNVAWVRVLVQRRVGDYLFLKIMLFLRQGQSQVWVRVGVNPNPKFSPFIQELFLRVLRFPLPKKPTLPNFTLIWTRTNTFRGVRKGFVGVSWVTKLRTKICGKHVTKMSKTLSSGNSKHIQQRQRHQRQQDAKHPEVLFSPFRAFSRSYLTLRCVCFIWSVVVSLV